MPHRMLLRCLTAGLIALGVVAGAARPAAAHSDLVGTEPPYGAALASGPDRVLLRFNYPVDLGGANLRLERSGAALEVGTPTHASPDRKEVSLPLQGLGEGSYRLTWSVFAQDGHIMAGELAFSVLPAAREETPGPPTQGDPPTQGVAPVPPHMDRGTATQPAEGADLSSLGQRPFSRHSTAQAAARLVSFMALAVLVGGVAFVARLWPAGAALRRTRLLLWGSLTGALLSTTALLGLNGAAIQDRSALAAISPSALTAPTGSHIGQMLVARLGFLLLAVPVVMYLTIAPQRAIRSYGWLAGAATSGLGVVATHGLLGHSFDRGPLASATDVVHLAAVAVWLGGLVMLAAVVLPRRRGEELSLLVPRFSRLAFASVATAAVAGTTLLVLISPRWTALPSSGYGRFLLVKLGLVTLLLVVASRSRNFVRRRLPGLTPTATVDLTEVETPDEPPVLVGKGTMLTATTRQGGMVVPGSHSRPAALSTWGLADTRIHPENVTVDSVPLRPFVISVTAELCLAAGILAATAVLVGRSPPT
jgi:copper transport protein